jgi:hypothetical protein
MSAVEGQVFKIDTNTPKTVALLFSFGVVALCLSCTPSASRTDNTPIDTSNDPEQVMLDTNKVAMVETNGKRYEISLVACYRIGGLVLGHMNMPYDSFHGVITCSVGMAWGRLVDLDKQRMVDWGFGAHEGWAGLRPELQPGADIDLHYLASHFSITGIIPANKSVDQAAKTLSYGEIAELSGFLAEGSSLTRDDDGPGSGEILYTTRIRVHGMVFE